MNYEEMILFIAKNGLASKVIKKVLSTITPRYGFKIIRDKFTEMQVQQKYQQTGDIYERYPVENLE
jgi:hypothetical protein